MLPGFCIAPTPWEFTLRARALGSTMAPSCPQVTSKDCVHNALVTSRAGTLSGQSPGHCGGRAGQKHTLSLNKYFLFHVSKLQQTLAQPTNSHTHGGMGYFQSQGEKFQLCSWGVKMQCLKKITPPCHNHTSNPSHTPQSPTRHFCMASGWALHYGHTHFCQPAVGLTWCDVRCSR